MMITLDDVACLLHLPIIWAFRDHEKIDKEEAIMFLVERLGVTLDRVLAEVDKTCGYHMRYRYLSRVFADEIVHV